MALFSFFKNILEVGKMVCRGYRKRPMAGMSKCTEIPYS